MRIASITWNPDSDITKVTFSDEFLKSHWVVKADVLQDLSHMMQDAYREVRENNKGVLVENKILEKSIKL